VLLTLTKRTDRSVYPPVKSHVPSFTQLCVVRVMTCPIIKTHTHTHTHTERERCIYIQTHTHRETHTRIYTHTYTNKHTHMYMNKTQIDKRM